ncbi:hypothetical protein [Alsobacter sp. SYSU BS001988]
MHQHERASPNNARHLPITGMMRRHFDQSRVGEALNVGGPEHRRFALDAVCAPPFDPDRNAVDPNVPNTSNLVIIIDREVTEHRGIAGG